MTDLRQHIGTGLAAFACISAIVFWYHDQFWWPVDEGVYAYVAQRALAGDVLHRDLIDLHGGYGNLVNILAFQIFGEDLLSLRYPLVAITLLQSAIVYVLLASSGRVVALIGAVAVAAFSFVQFPNPSANWHALGLFFVLCLCLATLRDFPVRRLFLAGLIVGLCFFTRQLSGVFLGLGLVGVLLSETADQEQGSRAPAFVIGGTAFAALLVYLVSKQQVFGLLWAGIWPLALLVIVTLRSRMTWAFAGRTAGLVMAGFVLAGLPLAGVAWYHGALTYWVTDIFLAALIINGQAFIANASFASILGLGWQAVTQGAGLVPVLSGTAWIALVASVPFLGVLTLSQLVRNRIVSAPAVLAVFWSVSALHYQIPIYLIFCLPAVLFAILVVRPLPALAAATFLLSVYMILFQAGQPLERGIVGTVFGVRAPPNQPVDLPRVSLRLQPADAAVYKDTITAIDKVAGPDEPLMTLPMDPELNFMTGRKSPVRYYGTPLGLTAEADVATTLAALDAAAPLFVVHRRQDKYLTPLSATLLGHVQDRSDPPVAVGPFDLYRYQGAGLSSARQ